MSEKHHNPHISVEPIRKSAHGIPGQPHTTPDTSKYFKDVFGQQQQQEDQPRGRATKLKQQAQQDTQEQEPKHHHHKPEKNAEDLGEEWRHPYSAEYVEGVGEFLDHPVDPQKLGQEKPKKL